MRKLWEGHKPHLRERSRLYQSVVDTHKGQLVLGAGNWLIQRGIADGASLVQIAYNRVGLDEAVHAEGRDAQEEQQDHAEADEDFDRDPGVRKEAHASASVSTVRI